ncbi:hypothetical protein VD659_10600 [Herbiconiux sp. 11R-BC]|uniref:hypothetical protein n=1 Tax=Herbiconiux sp. 11R-BC TaxID=3111637 RepID=UPI003C017C11
MPILSPPWWPVMLPLLHLAAVTVPLALADLREFRLPNTFVVPGLVLTGWVMLWAGLGGFGAAGPAPVGSGGASPAITDSGGAGPAIAGGASAAAVLGAGWAAGWVGMGDVKLGLWLGSLAGMTGALGRAESLSAGILVGAAVVSAQVFGAWTVGRGAGMVIPSRTGVRARVGRPVPADPVPDDPVPDDPAHLDPAHLDPLRAARHPLDPVRAARHPLGPVRAARHPLDPVCAARHPLGPALLAAFWAAELPLLTSP